ncbi:hypothetical protein [Plantibacter sp. YIM 135347]|uniref:hypothetical protein n=1 Tax=Plantibacter sp. YIM 135347 TaxID=3423919 RepID=UPI003D35064C
MPIGETAGGGDARGRAATDARSDAVARDGGINHVDSALTFDAFEFAEVPRQRAGRPVLFTVMVSVLAVVALVAMVAVGARTILRSDFGTCLFSNCWDIPAGTIGSRADIGIGADASILDSASSDSLKSRSLRAVIRVGIDPITFGAGYTQVAVEAENSTRLGSLLAEHGVSDIDEVWRSTTVGSGSSQAVVVIAHGRDGSRLAFVSVFNDL